MLQECKVYLIEILNARYRPKTSRRSLLWQLTMSSDHYISLKANPQSRLYACALLSCEMLQECNFYLIEYWISTVDQKQVDGHAWDCSTIGQVLLKAWWFLYQCSTFQTHFLINWNQKHASDFYINVLRFKLTFWLTGKTMLMDMFFNATDGVVKQRKRLHFHAVILFVLYKTQSSLEIRFTFDMYHVSLCRHCWKCMIGCINYGKRN
jgi:hypothetical protein